MKKDIVLLRPPMIVPRWAHVSNLCPPLGLAYVAASLRKAGFPVRCVDAIGEAPFQRIVLDDPRLLSYGLSTREIVERIGACDVVGISFMFSQDWPLGAEIIREIRKANPDALIVCGGEHATACPEFCLEDCPALDACVRGEGEETFVDLLTRFEERDEIPEVPGVTYRGPGGIRSTPARPRIQKLDEIPDPAWDLFPLEAYLEHGLGYGVHNGRTMPILASRGCPFECTFCSSPNMWTTRWQARAVDDLLREMEACIRLYRVDHFDFYDLTAIVRRDWVVEFARKLIEKGWGVTWQMPAGTRSEALDPEVLALLRESNMRNLTYAPESGSPATLAAIKKKVRLERMKPSIRAAIREGLNVKLNIVIGFPGERRRDIARTVLFLLEMAWIGVQDAYPACFAPYPGTELFDQLRASGKIRALDRAYFARLTCYSDLSFAYSYSPHLGHGELMAYRLLAMFLFYAAGWLLHPLRLMKVLFNVATGRQEYRLDMALGHLKERMLSKKKRAVAGPLLETALKG